MQEKPELVTVHICNRTPTTSQVPNAIHPKRPSVIACAGPSPPLSQPTTPAFTPRELHLYHTITQLPNYVHSPCIPEPLPPHGHVKLLLLCPPVSNLLCPLTTALTASLCSLLNALLNTTAPQHCSTSRSNSSCSSLHNLSCRRENVDLRMRRLPPVFNVSVASTPALLLSASVIVRSGIDEIGVEKLRFDRKGDERGELDVEAVGEVTRMVRSAHWAMSAWIPVSRSCARAKMCSQK